MQSQPVSPGRGLHMRPPYPRLPLAILILGACVTAASAKTCRTYYDDARIGVMRENLERYGWARQYRKWDGGLATHNTVTGGSRITE